MFWRIKKFNSEIDQYSPEGRLSSWIGLIISVILFGASFNDYISYKFWEKSLRQRNEFITYKRSKRLIKKYNLKGKWQIFQNKAEFNRIFANFIHRDWLELNNATEDEINTFIKKHDVVIIKETNGSQGKGVRKVRSSDINVKSLVNKDYILEEEIKQNKTIEALNPSSCNTIRIYTFLSNDVVTIMCAALKIGGSNSCVDNLNSGGVCAVIDTNNGIVITQGINYQYQYMTNHPITGEKIIGFCIPNWEQVVATVKECAKTVPSVKYVGWDIAITKDGCEVVEGNHDPGHRILQMIDQVGKYKMVK